MNYLGDFGEDDTIYLMFNTFTSDNPSASCTITNFANTDVHIHKDGGLAQRNNAAGITVTVDYDGVTGSHLISIDTSDGTVAGFWVTGSDYFVRIEGTTIDAATINAAVGHFSIENRFMRGTDSAEVNAQVVDVMRTDTTTEMSQGAPPSTPTMEEMISYIYFSLRNKNVETSTEHQVFDDAGTTVLFKADMADSAGVLTKSEYVSGV